MNDFNPEADRLRQAKQAATLAKLRAAAADPRAADRLAAAAVQEPDPTAIHRGILRKRFPNLPNITKGWPRGLPDLRALAGLAELAAYFSPSAVLRRRRELREHFRTYFRATPEQQRQMEIATLGHPLQRRRSPWSRLAFWRRR